MILRRARIRSRRKTSESALQERILRMTFSGLPRQFKVYSSLLLQGDRSLYFDHRFSNCSVLFARWVSVSRYLVPKFNAALLNFGGNDVDPTIVGPLALAALDPGISEIVTTDDTEYLDPQYFFMYEEGKIETHATATVNPDRNIGGELLFGTRKDGEPDTVLTREPLTQPYGSGARLSIPPSSTVISKNITVRGLRIRAKNELGFGSWVTFGWIDGLTVVDCHGVDGMEVGFSVIFSRNIKFYRCSGRNLPQSPISVNNPWGYTFQCNRSTNSEFDSIVAYNGQFALTAEGGSAALVATNLYYTTSANPADQACFDVHGGEAYDLHVSLAMSPGVGNSIGNASWRRGASQVVLLNSTYTRLRIVSGIHNLDVVDCNCENVKYEYISKDPNSGSWDSNPINHSFLRTKIHMPSSHPDVYAVSMPANGSVDQSLYKIDGLTFSECEITNDNNSAVLVVGANTKSASSINFDSCTLTLPGASAANHAIVILTNAKSPTPLSLSLFVYGTVFMMANNQEIASGTSATTTTKFFDDGQNARGPAMNSLRDICKDDVVNMDKTTLPDC